MYKNIKPHILVTGANGFVGHGLCEELLARDYIVDAVIRNTHNFSLQANKIMISNLKLEQEENLQKGLNRADIVFHLAARVHITHGKADNPVKATHEVNVQGTANLARQAAAMGVKRFVFISTIGVNGAYTLGERSFNQDSPPRPHNTYAKSKWSAEQALHEISRETGLEVVIIRPPLVYGPNAKANFLQLIKLIRSGVPIPLGAVVNKRSFIYLGNLIDALILAALHPAASGQTYTISDNETTSTPAFICLLARELKRPCHIFPFPLFLLRGFLRLLSKESTLDKLTQSLVVDNSKIKHDLGWNPPYTLQQGLAATARSYLKNIC